MRKKKPPEHENHERWLVSYADFITLLFAFFVVMFAISQVDVQKMGRFVESMNIAFDFPIPAEAPIQGGGTQGPHSGKPTIVPSKSMIPEPVTTRRSVEMCKQIDERVRGSELEGKVHTRLSKRGVVVSLREGAFFDPGEADIKPDALSKLRAIGELLEPGSIPIIVEGHTDNTPIHTPQFPSNWELSTARAAKIVAYLIDELHYDPQRLSIAGYAEYRPVAENDTSEGRAANRRVDLVVLTEGSDGAAPK
ncbi:MAG TPA: flagellar motor protein MotB [Candidatus Polarisedimenticolia bacterium]|nr:flagellar motor protein MotB [Candidatus Polarisedimenticolia bacterium]